MPRTSTLRKGNLRQIPLNYATRYPVILGVGNFLLPGHTGGGVIPALGHGEGARPQRPPYINEIRARFSRFLGSLFGWDLSKISVAVARRRFFLLYYKGI